MSQVPVQASTPAGGPPSAPVSAPKLSEKEQEIAKLEAEIEENDDLARKARAIMDDDKQSKDERDKASKKESQYMEASSDASDQLKVLLAQQQGSAQPASQVALTLEAIEARGSTCIFAISIPGNGVGQGFFLTRKFAVAPKHLWTKRNINPAAGIPVECFYYIVAGSPYQFHMVINYVDRSEDFVLLRDPIHSSVDEQSLLLRKFEPSVFPVGASRLGAAHFVSLDLVHQGEYREAPKLFLDGAFIARCKDYESVFYFTSDFYPGDSGAYVVLQGGHIVGIFTTCLQGTPEAGKSPPVAADEAGVVDLSVLNEALDALSDTSSDLVCNKGKYYTALKLGGIIKLIS